MTTNSLYPKEARLKSVIEEALTLVHSLFPGENLKMKS